MIKVQYFLLQNEDPSLPNTVFKKLTAPINLRGVRCVKIYNISEVICRVSWNRLRVVFRLEMYSKRRLFSEQAEKLLRNCVFATINGNLNLEEDVVSLTMTFTEDKR